MLIFLLTQRIFMSLPKLKTSNGAIFKLLQGWQDYEQKVL